MSQGAAAHAAIHAATIRDQAPPVTFDRPPTRFDAAARRAVLAMLRRMRGGELVLVERDGSQQFGASGASPTAAVTVRDERAYAAVLRHGSVGLGTAYERGWYEVDDVAAMLRLLLRSTTSIDSLRGRVHDVIRPVREMRARRHSCDPDRDRHNVRRHYDLGNDFFERFLDESLTYSCAIFDGPDTSLADAQTEKLDRLCRRLGLGPTSEVVEIGSGWGSFALHAARRYGCRVTTTTISAEQYTRCRERVHEAGLDHLVTVLHEHYLDVRGSFDALVSIEMIEAVDWRDHDAYFNACERLLAPGGVMGLQAIVTDDRRYDRMRFTADFIKQRIFPGGCLPSIEAIERSTARAGTLSVQGVEHFGHDYAETLRRWRSALVADPDPDAALTRLFEFYLAYCEAGFEEGTIDVVQMVLAPES